MSETKSMTFPPARSPFFLHESEWQYQTDFASFTQNVFLLSDECDGKGQVPLSAVWFTRTSFTWYRARTSAIATRPLIALKSRNGRFSAIAPPLYQRLLITVRMEAETGRRRNMPSTECQAPPGGW